MGQLSVGYSHNIMLNLFITVLKIHKIVLAKAKKHRQPIRANKRGGSFKRKKGGQKL